MVRFWMRYWQRQMTENNCSRQPERTVALDGPAGSKRRSFSSIPSCSRQKDGSWALLTRKCSQTQFSLAIMPGCDKAGNELGMDILEIEPTGSDRRLPWVCTSGTPTLCTTENTEQRATTALSRSPSWWRSGISSAGWCLVCLSDTGVCNQRCRPTRLLPMGNQRCYRNEFEMRCHPRLVVQLEVERCVSSGGRYELAAVTRVIRTDNFYCCPASVCGHFRVTNDGQFIQRGMQGKSSQQSHQEKDQTLHLHSGTRSHIQVSIKYVSIDQTSFRFHYLFSLGVSLTSSAHLLLRISPNPWEGHSSGPTEPPSYDLKAMVFSSPVIGSGV